jgi:hypothetical protein
MRLGSPPFRGSNPRAAAGVDASSPALRRLLEPCETGQADEWLCRTRVPAAQADRAGWSARLQLACMWPGRRVIHEFQGWQIVTAWATAASPQRGKNSGDPR